MNTNDQLIVATSRNHAKLFNEKSNLFCFDKFNNIHNASVGFLMQGNHHLLSKFNQAIRNALEFGLVDHWKKKYEHTSKINNMTSPVSALKLKYVILAVVLLVVGWLLGVIAFICERQLYVYVQGKNLKKIYVLLEKFLNNDRYVGAFSPEFSFMSFNNRIWNICFEFLNGIYFHIFKSSPLNNNPSCDIEHKNRWLHAHYL